MPRIQRVKGVAKQIGENIELAKSPFGSSTMLQKNVNELFGQSKKEAVSPSRLDWCSIQNPLWLLAYGPEMHSKRAVIGNDVS